MWMLNPATAPELHQSSTVSATSRGADRQPVTALHPAHQLPGRDLLGRRRLGERLDELDPPVLVLAVSEQLRSERQIQ
ncbi:hypothetical protein [Actinoplanes utahensis]|uniref:hypothetical protein n=2 Tax=Actinoplanes utahensis TaxID=1869 RepID=UPI00126A41DC|nr:hypothetical protein [Actinoplanes utahensis]